ncbi:hypothetical protein BX616_004069 [Lobosporangium transversale]|uniref:Cytochrome P450 n=1 Tax=Lobosporangium transversale TaxID=64571 RepID=A0A1Y2H0T6_9FUNG|nr:cytochrome P450 [Lobosporangium transversale]KAF9916317.1 hypothetical protein BX616_004069 [Lobosporangium transversale]ORZ28158.1 cytochrome P450 [Lobosporangium transversale]|eukprot:XP_021885843.1 cytochrome P450 [Lobosporangium transversale]
MATVIAWIGLKKRLEKYLIKRKRSSLEYVVLATLGFVVAATLKYPDRAFLTTQRPDLKASKKAVRGYPLIGNLPTVINQRHDHLSYAYNYTAKHGDVIAITLPFFGQIIIINRPELMEHILKTNFDNYVKGNIFRWLLSDVLGNGIFVTDGDEWRLHRKTASNIFTTKLYRSLVEGAFRTSAHDLCQVIETQCCLSSEASESPKEVIPIDLQANFFKLTLDAFAKLTFGIDFKSLTSSGPNEFAEAFDYLTAAADARLANPLWFITEKFPGNRRRHQGAIATLDKYAFLAISSRHSETPEQKSSRPQDLLDYFINHKRDDGTTLTDRDLRDVFVNFMVAGRDTTAVALTWQFYSLMANPRIMKNIVQEIDTVLKGSEDAIKYEVLMNEMPYTKAVFHETLRLHPPVPKNFKQAVADDVLPDGTRVKKGDLIGYSNWCLGRNKSVWGVDAGLFVPERWLVPDEQGGSPFGKFKPENPYKFITFNAGPRLCLGQTFAILEAMATTCILLQRFHFQLVPNHPTPQVKGSVTLPMKDPLMTIVTKRQNIVL